MEFGVRINNRAYFKFSIDLDSCDIGVIGEIITDDEGTKFEPTGYVVWEEGE